MTARTRLLLLGLALGLILMGVGWRMPSIPWVGPSAPVDRVLVLYESANQPLGEVGVMNGPTSLAVRKAGKWLQFDHDQIPEGARKALDPIVAECGVPCIILERSGRVAYSGKLPASDAELAELLARKGGY